MNRSKIRSDVLKIMDELQENQLKGVFEFLEREENQGVDFQGLWNKVMEMNALFSTENFERQKIYMGY